VTSDGTVTSAGALPPNPIRHLGRSSSIVAAIRGEYDAGRTVRVVPAGRDKAESLALFAEILDFPAHVGRNLDALYDALRTYARDQGGPWSLIWDAAGGLRAGDRTAYEGILGVLADTATTAPGLHVTVLDR
jgi:RNAse (barnase) inhibitor barstar